MSENEIKPVRRYEVDQFGMSEDSNGYYVTYSDHKSAIDRLTAERDDALAAADSKAGWEWKKRAEKAEAERDAAVADAARWQELCRQIDAGTFPSIVIDDAMAMGAGALELQVDAARAQERKE